MKKILLIALCALSFSACADNTKVIDYNTLPAAAQQLMGQYVTSTDIIIATQEGLSIWAEYEVLTSDQSKWEFNAKGRLKSIEILTGVPESLIPPTIWATATKMYPNATIIKYSLDNDDREQEMKLINGIELTFDLQGRLREADID